MNATRLPLEEETCRAENYIECSGRPREQCCDWFYKLQEAHFKLIQPAANRNSKAPGQLASKKESILQADREKRMEHTETTTFSTHTKQANSTPMSPKPNRGVTSKGFKTSLWPERGEREECRKRKVFNFDFSNPQKTAPSFGSKLFMMLAGSFIFLELTMAIELQEQQVPLTAAIEGGEDSKVSAHSQETFAADIKLESDRAKWSPQLPSQSKSLGEESKLLKRANLEQVSSADLLAEFRGDTSGDEGDSSSAHSSRLARLCQQTTSVLASVLPAPFGGHKRSVLCHFFGQVPFSFGGRKEPKPVASVGLKKPASGLQQEEQSIAILQQPAQMPVAFFPPAGVHPIEMVLRHQQQLVAGQEASQDLKAADSVLDYAYQQRVEPPPGLLPKAQSRPSHKEASRASHKGPPVRFSPPLSESSFKPLEPANLRGPPQVSAGSGKESARVSPASWRIFNQALELDSSPTTTVASTSTTSTSPSSSTLKALVSVSSTQPPPEAKQPEQSPLVMGKPPPTNTTQQKRSTEEPKANNDSSKKQESPKTTTVSPKGPNVTQSSPPVDVRLGGEVRTIEVVAVNETNSAAANSSSSQSAASPVSSSTQKPAQDLKQVQKREELVIASINNLTRIAFGNHLRDTVKVINKLIDQQSSLFAKPKTPDQLVAAESGIKVLSTTNSNAHKSTTIKSDKDKSPKSQARQKQLQTANSGRGTKKPSSLGKKLATNASQPTNKTARTTSKPEMLLLRKATHAATFSAKDAKSTSAKPTASYKWLQPDAKWTIPTRADSRRLSSFNLNSATTNGYIRPVSRSLNYPIAGDFLPKASADFDPMKVASTIVDLQRDNSRVMAKQQLNSVRAHNSLVVNRAEVAGFTPLRATTRVFRASSKRPPGRLERGELGQTSMGKYPWLVPDKSVVSDLLGGSVIGAAPWVESDRKYSPSSGLQLEAAETPSRWPLGGTTRKFSSPEDDFQAGPKLAAITNALDKHSYAHKTTKMDSLTTLKMSLMSSTTTTTQAPSTSQSRWIPTITRALPVTTTTTPTTTTTEPPPTSSASSSSPVGETTKVSSQSLSEIIEARASDTISKYTTHLNEANEALATTRRFYQTNGLPQIANTGEFFNAETIANWPERYQTMLDSSVSSTRSLKSSTPQAFETTRRNGETFAEEQSITTTARHRLQSEPLELDAQRSTLSWADLGNSSAVITILPANHKLVLADEQAQRTTLAFVETTVRPEVTKSTPGVQYTITGPYLSEGPTTVFEEAPLSTTLKFPQIDGSLPERAHENASFHNPLRPPYSASSSPNQAELTYPESLELENKPHVSRKLYQLLVPSTRNFVGSQNPLNLQKFNLSALKFLAQSLLSSSPNETSFGSSAEHPYLSSDQFLDENENLYAQNRTQQGARLLELLNVSLPASYYDFLETNESQAFSGKNVSEMEGGKSKSILNKASNLLSDLRRLEQKKAAAILAAIRYQVPSPLVRPWDLASDLYRHPQNSFLSDRFDEDQQPAFLPSPFRESLLLSYLNNAYRSSMINKQRLVPRAELEARLRLRSDQRNSGPDSERRLDSVSGKEFSLVDKQQNAEPKRNNQTQDWLGRLLSLEQSNLNGGQENINRTNDFDLINLSTNNSNISNNERASIGEVEFIDSPSSGDFRFLGNSSLSSPNKIHPSHSIANELSREKTNPRGARGESQEQFDCSQRQAGFYPDSSSSCQTFYHCSNTGHLLTFNCPQQTRFDQKSLKCGPWFEVPCDLGRSKFRHQ